MNVLRLNSEGASTSSDGTLVQYVPITSHRYSKLIANSSLTGTEGGRYGVQGGRQQQWAAGTLQRQQHTARNNDGKQDPLSFEVNMAGILDSGLAAYAAAGKVVPGNASVSQGSGALDRFITYLWLTGDFYGTFDFPGMAFPPPCNQGADELHQ